VPPRKLGFAILLSIVCGSIFYVVIIFAMTPIVNSSSFVFTIALATHAIDSSRCSSLD
jgi:hypothetical protein